MDQSAKDNAQDAAWHRIEAALARLEAAAHGRQGKDAALATRLRGELHDEQARHAALRQALRETLGRMDALIATHTAPEAGPQEDGAA